MLQPLTKQELDQYIALQDRVYLYAESIAEVYTGLKQSETVQSVKIANGYVNVEAQYSFDTTETINHWFPADFLTKSLDEIRGIRAAQEKSVADQWEKKEYEEYQRLKAKFEK